MACSLPGVDSVVVVWNPTAGSTNGADEVRSQILATPGARLVDCASREEAMRAVKLAFSDGVARIVAAGGDGTVNAVVTALVDSGRGHATQPEFAVLPLGTGNDLARTLKMPLDPVLAWPQCLSGTASPLDVLRIDVKGEEPRIAANMVTAGNTGRYADQLTEEMKRRWGALCYLRGVVTVLEELESFQAELQIEHAPPIAIDALNLFFANGKTSGGGMTVCQDALLDDGLMDVLVIHDGAGIDLARLTVDYLTSDVRENALVSHYRAERVHIRSANVLPLSIDGDAAGGREITIRVQKRALLAVRGRSALLPISN